MAGEWQKPIPERKRRKFKGRGTKPFISIPREVADSEAFGRLSPQGTKLLLELARQYRGNNNGDFSAAWSQLKNRGWKSPSTLARAKSELALSGFALVCRQGGRNRCSLYAITWWPIDECGGKHQERPSHVPLHLWKKSRSPDVY
jgi:hypothetical protein